MPYLDDIQYSRDETIEAVRSFYNFLTDMYLDPSAIAEPPAGGWLEITICPPGFDKTEEVMGLLKHLPYLKGEPLAGPYTKMADWHWWLTNSKNPAYLKDMSWGDLCDEAVPPHCIGLTVAAGWEQTFLLDTELGIIYWIYAYGGPSGHATKEQIKDDLEDFAPEEEEEWRRVNPAFSVKDLFEAVKDHFRLLNYVPITSDNIPDVWTDSRNTQKGMLQMVQNIYREHGWPDLNIYRKADCMAAILKAMQEHFPDEVR